MSTLTARHRFSGLRICSLPGIQTLHLKWMIPTLAIFAATRGSVFLAGYLANVALPSKAGDGLWHAMPGNVFLDVWARRWPDSPP